jgi:hypothetical protein
MSFEGTKMSYIRYQVDSETLIRDLDVLHKRDMVFLVDNETVFECGSDENRVIFRLYDESRSYVIDIKKDCMFHIFDLYKNFIGYFILKENGDTLILRFINQVTNEMKEELKELK